MGQNDVILLQCTFFDIRQPSRSSISVPDKSRARFFIDVSYTKEIALDFVAIGL